MKTITLEGGLKVITFPPPPKDFNPLTASADELKKYGFPPMPEDPHLRAQYEKVFNRIKHKLTFIEPTFQVNPHKFHGPRIRRPTDGTDLSLTWSGAVVLAPQGESFAWVVGSWVVPNVDAPTKGQTYYCSSWVGIDGDGNNQVFQAGVEVEVSNGNLNVYPWWEWFPAPEVQITSTKFSVRPGDFITVLLCSAQGAGSTSGTATFTNTTRGASMSFAMSAPANTQLIGHSAEWIVERPSYLKGQTLIPQELADYGEVFFSICSTGAPSGAGIVNGGTGDNINMTDDNGNLISEGNLITSEVVQCLYVGPKP